MLRDTIVSSENVGSGFNAKSGMSEDVKLPRAKGTITHRNAAGEILFQEEIYNLITTTGRDFMHSQCYAKSGAASVGLCYIALSNNTVDETSASTVLSGEIVTNGLSRVIADTVTHTVGTNTTAIDKVFTCASAPQAAQKAALFTAASNGTMNHVLGFTQRSLQISDTLEITFTITLG